VEVSERRVNKNPRSVTNLEGLPSHVIPVAIAKSGLRLQEGRLPNRALISPRLLLSPYMQSG
jgi:hypothetical protein